MAKKANKTSFKKGQVANPVGRPKGSLDEIKKRSIDLRNMAAKDSDKAYKLLWDAMEAKESWAHQIYFKELSLFKKEWLNEVRVDDVKKQMNNIEDTKETMMQLCNKLLEEESLSRDEVHKVIQTLNDIKVGEEFGKQRVNPFEKLDDDKMMQIHEWVKEVE